MRDVRHGGLLVAGADAGERTSRRGGRRWQAGGIYRPEEGMMDGERKGAES